MNEPRTLHEYIELRNLQRRKEFYLLNEKTDIPNAMTLDKQSKIDQLIMDILEYIKRLIGTGPLYQRFYFMIQNLHKLFHRELSEFHNISVAAKLKTDQKYIEQVRKANVKLNDYLKECEKQKDQTENKLMKLVKQNKELNTERFMINKKEPEPIIDNFDEDEGPPQKVVKLNRIDFLGDPAPNKTNTNLSSNKAEPTLSKNQPLTLKVRQQPKSSFLEGSLQRI